MRHRLQWLIYLWAQGLRKGDENRPPTLLIGYGTLHFFIRHSSTLTRKFDLSWDILHCVSEKNDTDLACYNSDVHQPILIIFGKTVAERVSYQIVIYFSTTSN